MDPPLPANDINSEPQAQQCLTTYTAGEDQGRLAEMAKQFGLEHHRQQRKQVRKIEEGNIKSHADSNFQHRLIYDHSIEVALMRSAYSRPHHHHHNISSISTDDLFHLDHVGVIARSDSMYSFFSQISDESDDNNDGSGFEATIKWMKKLEHDEEEMHDHHGVGGDLVSAVLGIIKGMIGPAILYLPHGLAQSGYAVAIPIMLLVTFLFLFSCQCLLDSWKLEHKRLLQKVIDKASSKAKKVAAENGGMDLEQPESSRTETTYLLNDTDDNNSDSDNHLSPAESLPHHKRTFFLSYPELAYRAFGAPFEQLVKLGITLMQSCVCLTYFIFVPQNFSMAVKLLWGVTLDPKWFLVVMVLIQLPLSFIRDIRKLTATNLLANILILYGWIVCIVLALKNMTHEDNDSEIGATDGSMPGIIVDRLGNLAPYGNEWFLFIGTSVFMFEGSITVLVPLQEAVLTEKDREKFPVVNRNTILCIVAFYIFFSMTCWVALGDDVRTVLTTSLPPGAAATTVQLAYSVAVIFTFPLQNYPALEIASRSVASAVKKWSVCQPCRGKVSGTWQHNITGSFLVVLLAVVAVTTMDSLDRVVSFLGGLLGCPVAFIFPPLIHSRLAGKAGTLTPERKVMNIIVALVGFLAMVLSTMTTLL